MSSGGQIVVREDLTQILYIWESLQENVKITAINKLVQVKGIDYRIIEL